MYKVSNILYSVRNADLENMDNLWENVEIIGHFAFTNCSISTMEIPSNIEVIDTGAFYYTDIECVTFNKGLRRINDRAFYLSTKLKSIELPACFETLGAYSFAKSGLEKVVLNKEIISIEEGAFANCKNLEYLEGPLSIKYISNDAFYNSTLKYFYKTHDTFIFSKEKLKNEKEYDLEKYIEYPINVMIRDDFDEICNRNEILKKKHVIYNEYCFGDRDFIEKIFFNENIDFIKGLAKRINIEETIKNEKYIFYKLMYNLGAFSDNKIERQRACNFIENLFEKKVLNFNIIKEIFEYLNIGEYNKEWAEFIMHEDNLCKLLKIETLCKGVILRTNNEFDSIKEFNRSNKGSQHYRKVTMEACFEYMKKNKFIGINKENEDIAVVLGKYTSNQVSFDEASYIREEFNKLKEEGIVKEHILDNNIIDKTKYDCIEDTKKNITKDIQKILFDLKQLANKGFKYEFLSKYDPDNFVLGKYCECCAHVEGIGFSIMKASILHPDCQNIVVRRKDGTIVSKATLFVNREQGYGVINTIEASLKLNSNEEHIVYDKMCQAIEEFCKEYNKENEIKIKQVNVGMKYNSLERIIKDNLLRGEILEGVDFTKYGKKGKNYEGDWKEEQYVLWKLK